MLKLLKHSQLHSIGQDQLLGAVRKTTIIGITCAEAADGTDCTGTICAEATDGADYTRTTSKSASFPIAK